MLFGGNLPRPYAPFAPVIDIFLLPLHDIVFLRSPLSTYLHAPAFVAFAFDAGPVAVYTDLRVIEWREE